MAARIETLRCHLQQTSSISAQQTSAAVPSVPRDDHFRHTVGGAKLSQEERRFYEENGYLVVRRLVGRQVLDRARERFQEICQRRVKVPGITIMRDVAIKDSEFVPGESAVTKIQNFQNDDRMFEYCMLPEVVDYVESFCGPDVIAMHSMLINKPPDSGSKSSRHPLHQDLYYFPFRPADRIVCSWTAMQTITRENGCLVVVPGSHVNPGRMLTHEYPKWEGGVNKMYHGIQDYDPSMYRVHLDMEEGDTVFFHPLLIHGSGVNRTKGFRKSISCHYVTGRGYYMDTMEPEQKVIEEELRQLYKKRGVDRGMTEVWRRKSRRVRGVDALNV